MIQVYLLLAVVGAAVPYLSFLPWLAEHGLNLPLLWQGIAGPSISAFAWWDVVLSVVTILVFARSESLRLGMPFPLWPLAACLLIGASCGLPLFLYQRERWLTHAELPPS